MSVKTEIIDRQPKVLNINEVCLYSRSILIWIKMTLCGKFCLLQTTTIVRKPLTIWNGDSCSCLEIKAIC